MPTETRVEDEAHIVQLEDGARVLLRAATDGDRDALRRLFFSLSDSTRYLYYCAGVPRTDDWAERFLSLGHADGCHSYALVAEVGESVIGVARFDLGADGRTAEVGLLLADAWQSRGLGRHVLAMLRAQAQRRAVTMLTGYTLWDNTRMLRLARRVFAHMEVDCAAGGCYLTMDLAAAA